MITVLRNVRDSVNKTHTFAQLTTISLWSIFDPSFGNRYVKLFSIFTYTRGNTTTKHALHALRLRYSFPK